MFWVCTEERRAEINIGSSNSLTGHDSPNSRGAPGVGPGRRIGTRLAEAIQGHL